MWTLDRAMEAGATEYEWQGTLSGMHSIMRVKSAQPGEGGGACLLHFTLSTITSKDVVYASAERAETLPLFSSITLYWWGQCFMCDGDKARGDVHLHCPLYSSCPKTFHI
jgi:hypothetical protein